MLRPTEGYRTCRRRNRQSKRLEIVYERMGNGIREKVQGAAHLRAIRGLLTANEGRTCVTASI